MEKHSELIIEHLIESGNFKPNGESKFTKGQYGYSREDFEIKNNIDAKKYKKPIGKYSLLTLKNILASDDSDNYYQKKLISALKDYLPSITNNTTILVVGLGNRHISSDSLGTEVVKNINITRNLTINKPKLCAFAPSVLGLTGIETADTIGGIVDRIKPDIIIIIDSLCASDVNRLGVSFQITNTPIIPGSGINNTRKKIKTNTTTISIGVPLVVFAETFIKSALNKAQININEILDKNLKSKLISLSSSTYNELVTLSEIEYSVKKIGYFIANAINNVVLT